MAAVGDEYLVKGGEVFGNEGAGAQVVNRHIVRAHGAAGARVGRIAGVVGVGRGGIDANVIALGRFQQGAGNAFRHRRAADVAGADHQYFHVFH